jgi:hypothetical protein
MSLDRTVLSASLLGLLAGCAGDRPQAAFPFSGTWIQVKTTSAGGDHVLDPTRIGFVSLAVDHVVVALADARHLVAAPSETLGSASSDSGCLGFADGTTLIVTRGIGVVEQTVGETRIGTAAPYLDLELDDRAEGKVIARARVWSESSLHPAVVLSAPPKPAPEPVKVAVVEPKQDPADAAFIAAARQAGPELQRAAEEMVRQSAAGGARSPQVAAECARGADDQRRRLLRLLIQARYSDSAKAQPLLLDAARLQRSISLFETAAASWIDARA